MHYFDENMQPVTVTMQDLQKQQQDEYNLTLVKGTVVRPEMIK